MSAMKRAMSWQRARSRVVKPVHPHWFFNSKHVALLRRVWARIGERTIGHEPVEQARNLQIFDEERELPIGRQRRCGIPFHPHRTGPTIKSCWRRCTASFNRWLFTRWVKRKVGISWIICLRMHDSLAKHPPLTAGFRFTALNQFAASGSN